MFEFNINEDTNLRIKLMSGTNLYYTGYGVMHHHKRKTDDIKEHEFWNLAEYSNKCLYESSFQSLK